MPHAACLCPQATSMHSTSSVQHGPTQPHAWTAPIACPHPNGEVEARTPDKMVKMIQRVVGICQDRKHHAKSIIAAVMRAAQNCTRSLSDSLSMSVHIRERYVMMHMNTLLTQVLPCRDHTCVPTARNYTFGSLTSRCMCAAIYLWQTDH